MDRARFWLRWAAGLLALGVFAFWSISVAHQSAELHERHERVVKVIRQLQASQRILQTTGPFEPAVDKALDELARTEDRVTAVAPGLAHGATLVETRAEQLRDAIPEPDAEARTEARTQVLVAVDNLMGTLWNEAESTSFERELQGLRVQALAGSAVALALIALLLWGIAVRRGLQRNRLTAKLEVALRSAQRASQAKSDFIAMVSHEVRTPLTAILGHAELLQRTELTPRQQDGLAVIQSGGDSLLHLLSDVLDMSRIEAGRLELREAPFDLEELLDGVALLYANRAEAKGLVLSVLVEAGVPRRVRGDASRLRQVLVNLVSNAVKFTDEGRVEVWASWEEGLLNVVVEDTGPGVSEEARALIFDPFTQAESGADRSHGGAGLGLTISRRLVDAMGGSLVLDSSEVGARFEVTARLEVLEEWRALPDVVVVGAVHPQLDRQLKEWGVGRAAEGPGLRIRTVPFGASHPEGALVLPVRPGAVRRLLEQRPSEDRSDLEVFDAGPRVLVVDDNAASREVLSQMLRAIGCEVGVAESGHQAVARAPEGWAVVFMDCDMPGMDGLEATRRILGDAPEMAILGLSGHATDDFRQDALEAGMREYLTKPIRLRELREAVGRHLDDPIRPDI